MKGMTDLCRTGWLPRSLRHRFRLILTVLAVLIVAGSLLSIQALRRSAVITRQLAGERLVQMEKTAELARTALLIEREMHHLLYSSPPGNMMKHYADIVEQLDSLNRLTGSLGAANEDVSILALYQAEQNFRNIVHIVVGLRQTETSAGMPGASSEAMQPFQNELEHQAMAMVETTGTLAGRSSEEFRKAVLYLAATTDKEQRRVLILLAVSLTVAWLISRLFLDRHVLSRLRRVNLHLLSTDVPNVPSRIPVEGEDEISEMARAVEGFLEDRRQLRLANQELERSLQEIKTLRQILPICSYCKKIRDDKGYWTQLEKYFHEHTGADFSHGICQECMAKFYPDIWEEMQENKKDNANETGNMSIDKGTG